MENDWYIVTPQYNNSEFVDDVIKVGEAAGFMQAEVDNAAYQTDSQYDKDARVLSVSLAF